MTRRTIRRRRPDAAALHRALVESLASAGYLTRPELEAAFRAVPRHHFLPGVPLPRVYRDEAIATKLDDGLPVSSSSQPAIMAIMLEQLGLRPGHRVLEIGAGTGYNAALIAHVVGDTGHVLTLDLDRDLVEQARANLVAAGCRAVQVFQADGGLGFPDGAPYDRIVLTVGAWDISPAWFAQLLPGGRLLLPLSLNGPQKAVAFERRDGHLASLSVHDCGFMRLRGLFAGPEHSARLGHVETTHLARAGDVPLDGDAVYGWLVGPAVDQPAGVAVTLAELWSGLHLWLALRDPATCSVTAVGPAAGQGLIPCLWRHDGSPPSCYTLGLLDHDGLALLDLAGSPAGDGQEPGGESAWPLLLRVYGPGDGCARRLAALVHAWDSAGRPGGAGLRLRAYPRAAAYQPAPGEILLNRPYHSLVLDWP